MWLKASLRHHRQGQATEGCADGNGAREKMKNESLTPNPSPKGEGSKMKNEEWGMKKVL